MATYISLIQFTDQGIRNVKDTIKRGEVAIAEAEEMGMKIIERILDAGRVRRSGAVRSAR